MGRRRTSWSHFEKYLNIFKWSKICLSANCWFCMTQNYCSDYGAQLMPGWRRWEWGRMLFAFFLLSFLLQMNELPHRKLCRQISILLNIPKIKQDAATLRNNHLNEIFATLRFFFFFFQMILLFCMWKKSSEIYSPPKWR